MDSFFVTVKYSDVILHDYFHCTYTCHFHLITIFNCYLQFWLTIHSFVCSNSQSPSALLQNPYLIWVHDVLLFCILVDYISIQIIHG